MKVRRGYAHLVSYARNLLSVALAQSGKQDARLYRVEKLGLLIKRDFHLSHQLPDRLLALSGDTGKLALIF